MTDAEWGRFVVLCAAIDYERARAALELLDGLTPRRELVAYSQGADAVWFWCRELIATGRPPRSDSGAAPIPVRGTVR